MTKFQIREKVYTIYKTLTFFSNKNFKVTLTTSI